MTATVPTRDTMTAGTVYVTVSLPENFVRAQALLGNEWHPTYRYRIDRSDDGRTFFLSAYTVPARKPDAAGRYVYTGLLHPQKGSVRLTTRSAFPQHATRVRVADRVFQALFAGRLDAITAAGWEVSAEVEHEVADRF